MNARGDVTLNATVREGEAPRAYTLALTLGAMAEIERDFGGLPFSEAMQQLQGERPSMTAIARVLTALIRAGGHEVTFDDVCRERFEIAAVTRALGDLFGGLEKEGTAADAGPRPPARTGRAGSVPVSATSD